ncbi:MAG: pyruvate dehydrogenase complex dihydrolipoamide acetyltransferase [Alphaproteobacteria bacterium]|nr:pyruvate dehydrogenase complex dihydrolipoamide acetyltransferase [Alphaproteobacteria bacterium]
MPIEILMPALSPTMTEGNLVKWHKREGDAVKAGDVLAEIETDKATMEVEAVDEGKVGKIIVPEGTENVKVNEVIALLLEEGEDVSALAKVKTEKAPAAIEAAKAPEKKPDLKVVTHEAPAGSRVFATPLARRIAEEKNLNLASLSGSGPRGRIVRADVEFANVPRPAVAPSVSLSGYEPEYEVIAPSNMRKVIAKRLVEAKSTIPHFYVSIDCQIDALLKAREQINARADGAYKLSVNDFIIKACGLTLKNIPEANSSWINDQIYQYASADVAVAVSIEGGLITPVVRHAEVKGIAEISKEMKDLAARAREGKLKPEEFQGGTFSLSNMGMYGVKDFSAIINPPQACILAIGAGEKRPVVQKDGTLAAATVMTCTLSVDHRVVDGALGAHFLKAFKDLIENPVMMIL